MQLTNTIKDAQQKLLSIERRVLDLAPLNIHNESDQFKQLIAFFPRVQSFLHEIKCKRAETLAQCSSGKTLVYVYVGFVMCMFMLFVMCMWDGGMF